MNNAGPGDGQAEIEVSLVNKQTGEVIQRATNNVNLKKDEIQHVLIEVPMPPSAYGLGLDQIDVQVDAHYPIE